MKNIILISLILMASVVSAESAKVPAGRDLVNEIRQLAKSNGFNPSQRIVNAIIIAAQTYKIETLELTAIGILETGLGKFAKTRKNKNGTHDYGVFQINTKNVQTCIEYNLDSPEGSALCAAKLLSQHKAKRTDYLGVYHSKTPSKKAAYLKKLSKVFQKHADKLSSTKIALNK